MSSNPWAAAQAQLLRIVAFGLDALIEQGVEVTPEQYKAALIETGRWMTTSGSHAESAYPDMLEEAIAQFLDEEEEHWQRWQ